MRNDTCLWSRCDKHPEDPQLPLCDEHAYVVYNRMYKRLSIPAGQTVGYTRRPDPPTGVVYYLQVGDLIKIGFTTSMAERISAYPPDAVLLATEPGTQALEAQRHQELRSGLVGRREWFTRTAEVDTLIAQVLAEHGEPRQPRRSKMKKHYPVTVTRMSSS